MTKTKIFRQGCMIVIGGVVVLCLILVGLSYWSNQHLPSPPADLSRLSELDKARLAETLHLKRELGEQIWPIWGNTQLPIIIWNRHFSFLVGMDEAPAGWEVVPDDTFNGLPYFRQVSGEPQNFAVRVGDQWAGSMATKWDTDAKIQDVFRDLLPPHLEDIFPYHILILPSEVQITAGLHELFHAYQSTVVPVRLAQAEAAHRQGEAYWATGMDGAPEWREEIRLLSQAVRAKSDEEARQLAADFLAIRQKRRQIYQLNEALVDYERQLEWEEGVAKYVEVNAWKTAWQSLATYQPLDEVLADPDFQSYRSFENRWNQESGLTMTNSASQTGETPFYYTGMAQAFLLDRFLPGWKQRLFSEEIWLEALLAEALRGY